MKKILFFIESLGGGGAEKVITDIVRNINKDKYDITVVTVTDSGIYNDEISKHCTYKSILSTNNKNLFNRIIYKIKYKLIYKLPCKLIYKFVINDKYDIEIAFVEGFATKFIATSSNKRSKKIAWVHVDPIDRSYSDNYFKNLNSQINCYKKYNNIICVSNAVANSFKKKFEVYDTVKVIYNPIDSNDIINKSKDTTINIKKDKLTLCTIGRLTEQKGYDRLLKIIKKLKNEGLNFELWILGDGEQRDLIENYIYKNNLNDFVKLLGFNKNPYKYLKLADIFVCSSRAEGFSLAIAEAMVLGVPIISTNCSGPSELLSFGDHGILVDNDISSLYEGIKNLICDEDKREYIKNKSIERSNIFNINEVIGQIEKLLNEGGE